MGSDGTISEVGRLFARDVSTLSACIKRMTEKSKNDPGVAERMVLLKQLLVNKASKQT